MKVKLQLPSAAQIIRSKGLAADGAVQMFHTRNALNRLERYVHFNTGTTYKITVVQTDIRKPEIVTDTPYAKYLFHGKVMIDPKINAAGFMTSEGWRSRRGCTKVVTQRNLQFTNKRAGPRWDKALSANEGKAMAADLQRFIDKRSGAK